MSEPVLENKPCPLHPRAGDRHLFDAPDRLHGLPGTFSIVQCDECGLIRTNPRPDAESMGQFYPDDYGPYVATRVQAAAPGAKRSWKRRVRPLIRWLQKDEVLPPALPGRMLEVGCASGSFLALMQANGWQVEGIEFSPSAAKSARSAGFSVHTGSIEGAPAPSEPFDLIVAWMVLEHLHEPILALRKLADWAAPGAALVVSTPNAASLDFRVFRDLGFALQVPTHLYHYTPDSLTAVLEAGGWQVEKVYHQRSEMNLMVSLAYWARERGLPTLVSSWLQNYPEKAKLSRLVFQPLAQVLGLLGHSGRMTIWARRKN